MLDINEVKEIMKGRGYSIHYYNGPRTHFTFIKRIGNSAISADIDMVAETIKLTAVVNTMFTLTSGKLAFDHPHFKSIFETKMIIMLNTLGET